MAYIISWHAKGYQYADQYDSSEDAWDAFRSTLTGEAEREYINGDQEYIKSEFGLGFAAGKVKKQSMSQRTRNVWIGPSGEIVKSPVQPSPEFKAKINPRRVRNARYSAYTSDSFGYSPEWVRSANKQLAELAAKQAKRNR